MENILTKNEIEKAMFEETSKSKDEEIEITKPMYEQTRIYCRVGANDEKEDNSCYKCEFIGKTKASFKTHILTKQVSTLRKYPTNI